MAKYKIKSKNKKLTMLFMIFIMIGFTMILSVGYSLWSTSIKIVGNVTLEPPPKPPDPPDGPGLGEGFTMKGNYYLDVLSLNAGGQQFAAYIGETVEGNRLISTYDINDDYDRGNKSLNLSTKFTIQNTSDIDWTDGRVECNVYGSTSAVSGMSMNVGKSIKKGQSNNTNIHFSLIPELVTEMTIISYKLIYNVGGTDGYVLVDIIFMP